MQSRRILYVDDEPDLRDIAKIALELDEGFEVQTAADGPSALALARQWQPHLILIDVMMPGMDGPATLAALRSSPDIVAVPAVFITARTQRHEFERLMALGAAGVIAKPFDPLALAAQVRGFLEKAPCAER